MTLGDWKAWIGRSQVAEDVVTARLIESFRATLTSHLAEVDPEAPLGLHWRLAPDIVEAEKLGNDGHPPPVPGGAMFVVDGPDDRVRVNWDLASECGEETTASWASAAWRPTPR